MSGRWGSNGRGDTPDRAAERYLSKHAEPADFLRVVRAARSGETGLPPRVAATVLELGPHRLQVEELPPRAREVLALLAQGRSNQAIGRELGIAEKTVKGHLTAIFDHLGVSNRIEAALWAHARVQELGPQRLVPTLHLARRGRRAGRGEDVIDAVVGTNPVEEHRLRSRAEAGDEHLDVVGDDRLGHSGAGHGQHEGVAPGANRGSGDHLRRDHNARVVIDAGDDLGL